MEFITNLIIKLPIYPHWLDFKNNGTGNNKLLMNLYGNVIETGAGTDLFKNQALSLNKKIRTYTATDYNSWDEPFKKCKKAINKFGKITQILYGEMRNLSKLDKICNALDLPFKNNSFDCYCSFDVLEHINDPERFYIEANRVLKMNGLCITTMPFLYRDHGGIELDFQRFTKGGFIVIAKKTGFKIISIKASSYFGTTISMLINQYVIRKIMEKNIFVKISLLLFSPFIFTLSNSLGYIIDCVDHDDRFSPHYHVIMKKIKNIRTS
ncbi:MAG: methyltransferase domain-containing protein [Candidatus Levyibacteriota bacterium]